MQTERKLEISGKLARKKLKWLHFVQCIVKCTNIELAADLKVTVSY